MTIDAFYKKFNYDFLSESKIDSETLDLYFDNYVSLALAKFLYSKKANKHPVDLGLFDRDNTDVLFFEIWELDEIYQHLFGVLIGFGKHTLDRITSFIENITITFYNKLIIVYFHSHHLVI